MSKRNLLKLLLGLIIFAVYTADIFADQPLEKPEDKTIYSANRKFCVEMKIKEKKTTGYAISTQGKKQIRNKLWEMDGWFYNAALANDGDHLIVGYYKRNLLDLNYSPGEIMLSFYEKGVLFQTVRLNQLIENFSNLPRTSSHYAWLKMFGFDQNNRYSLTTFENRLFLFDPATGKPTNIELLQPAASSEKQIPNDPPPASNISQINSSMEPAAKPKATPGSYCLGLAGSLVLIGFIHKYKSRLEKTHEVCGKRSG